MDRRVHAFGGIRGSSFASAWWRMESFTSLSWHTWIVVYMPLMAYGDRRPQAFGGRWSHLQAFGGIRGSSCTRLLLAYVDCLLEAFGGIRGLSFPSLWWLRWIAVHKPLVADGLVYQPFGGLRGSPLASLWWQMGSLTSLWWHTWIVVHNPLVADGVIYKPLVAYMDRRVQGL